MSDSPCQSKHHSDFRELICPGAVPHALIGELFRQAAIHSCTFHINVTMPKGSEDIARNFYGGLLGLREIPKPEPLRVRGGVWFDAGGFEIHLSIEEQRLGSDAQRHFGLECADLDRLRANLMTAGIKIDDGRPAPWKRFFVLDPFGNRIEVHEAGGLRA